MLKSDKTKSLKEIEQIYESSNSIIIMHYHGLKVAQMTQLRRNLRDKESSLKIVKNSLAKIAATNIGLEYDASMFTGPVAIAYSKDPVIAAKVVVDFANDNDILKVIGGVVEGVNLDALSINNLAKMPSLDALKGKIISILQTPASNIIGILQASGSKLARVLDARAKKQ